MNSRGRRLRGISAAVSAAVLTGAGVALAVPASAAAYDLVVTDVRPVLTGVQASGSEVTFRATIKNRGTAATPAVVHGVAFAVNGRTVSWNDVSTGSLAPGATRTLTAVAGPAGKATWTAAAAGSYALRAWVDDVDRIPGESDEGNNTRTATVTTAPVKAATGVQVAAALDQATFAVTHEHPVAVSWTAPAGQPAGTTYTVVEHPVSPNGGFCPQQGDVVRATVTGTTVTLPTLATGLLCSAHGEQSQSTFTVTAGTAGAPGVVSAPSGTTVAGYTHNAGTTGPVTSWWFQPPNGASLSDAVYEGTTVAHVDAGGPGDTGYDRGQVFTAPGDAPAEWRSVRWGWGTYRVPVAAPGRYQVQLTFYDPTWWKAGQRVFSLDVEGRRVRDRLDIAGQVGQNRALTVTAYVDVTDGAVTVDAHGLVDNSILSEVRVSSTKPV